MYPYFAMPDNFLGNQLKTYGGYLKYTVKFDGNGRPVDTPDVILSVSLFSFCHYQSILLCELLICVVIEFLFFHYQRAMAIS